MLRFIRVTVVALLMAATSAMGGCYWAPSDPGSPGYGYKRGARGEVLIAYPSPCPKKIRNRGEVYSAEISVPVEGGFKTLWLAHGPRSAKAREGLFVVGNDTSFTTEKKPLKARLPRGFYVSVTEMKDGKKESGYGTYVDLARLEDAKLKPTEYMTSTGEVMTRTEINKQFHCPGLNNP